ncbi:MAG: SufD family Fe-S cluster assembly protein [Coriobacteriaceae bacterium]|nr:SufD family Fe-S cluster assembly protein [Coriobacteriaceae bacterium]
MDAMNIRHASAMPAPTWSWLKMNDCTLPVPAGLERDCRVTIEVDSELLEHRLSFEGALEGLEKRLYGEGAPADERAMARAATGTDAGAADLDTPSLSTYQKRATRSELGRSVIGDFETGVGVDARAYLNFLAAGTAVIATEPGSDEAVNVNVETAPGSSSGASVDIIAGKSSRLEVNLSLNCEDAEEAPSFMGSTLRVFADEDAFVDLTVYVTGAVGTTCVEDEGFVLAEGARVRVRHVVLSGGFTATGLAADLRGDDCRIDIDTRYLARGEQTRDFNYIIRHRGKKTVSTMDANGVLAGASKKCLRGTIDLIHGCKGAEGTERETVLLASRGVDNKTVPTILCDEDDVAGNHGATIGHVRPEQLFYAACRGLSPDSTEALFMRAKYEDAYLNAPTDRIRANVLRLAGELMPDFEEEMEEEEAAC